MEYKKTIGEYTLIQSLGKGAFARVYLARKVPYDTQYAIKVFDPSKSKFSEAQLQSSLRNEVELYKSIRHPNIVNLIDFDMEGTKQ